MAPSFPFFFFFPPSPHPLSHTQTPQTIHFLRSHTLRHISPGALFSWKWLIREAVENCGSSAPSMHTVRSYCLKNYIWLTVTRWGFFFTPAPFYQPTSVVLSFCRSFHTSVGSSRDIKFWPSCNDQTMVHCDVSLSLNEIGEKQFIVATLFCYTRTNTRT